MLKKKAENTTNMFNLELIKKYSTPGPRYTSYPTAPHFRDNFQHSLLIDEIIRNNDKSNTAPLSLYYHLPFCDTLCYFCGCHSIISNNRARISKYVDYLIEETELLLTYINNKRVVNQIHWGGGTPTHLSPDEIFRLKSFINSHFQINSLAEQGCEIDPRGLTKEHLSALKETGFNRLSLGIQDFNPEVQKAVNRIQSLELTNQVIEWIRELGFISLNLDLIYGLPFQTYDEFEKTINHIIDLSPDRIALFNYAYVPWVKPHMKLIDEATLPSAEVKLSIFRMAIEKLTSAGYIFIGMDHFAKPEDELSVAQKENKLYRNFQGYSTNSDSDLYALGISSISQFGNIYSQNVKEEKEYFEMIDKGFLPVSKGFILSEDDQIRRYVITKLMCNFRLDFQEVEKLFSISFNSYFSESLNMLGEMAGDGLVTINSNSIVIEEKGRLLIRNAAMCFDAYLKNDSAKYSRTI